MSNIRKAIIGALSAALSAFAGAVVASLASGGTVADVPWGGLLVTALGVAVAALAAVYATPNTPGGQ